MRNDLFGDEFLQRAADALASIEKSVVTLRSQNRELAAELEQFKKQIPPTSDKISYLLQLIDSAQWYQPSYNGSPSCPWCSSQYHWGHSENCPVEHLGIATNEGKEE